MSIVLNPLRTLVWSARPLALTPDLLLPRTFARRKDSPCCPHRSSRGAFFGRVSRDIRDAPLDAEAQGLRIGVNGSCMPRWVAGVSPRYVT